MRPSLFVFHECVDRVRRFCADERGTVTIESLLSLPLLLFWYVASFVFFDAFRMMNVNEKAAYTVSDILSRTQPGVELHQADINNMQKLFTYLTQGEGATTMRVTSVSYNTTSTKYSAIWSAGTTGVTTLPAGEITQTAYTDRLPLMYDNETILVVETTLVYTPPFNVGLGQTQMSAFVFTAPRFVLSGIPYS